MIFGNEMTTREWLLLLWKGKYRILAFAFVAAIVGVLIVTTIPKAYEANLVARPASEAALAPLSDLLSVPTGSGRQPVNMAAAAKLAFLAVARDRDYLRAYVLSHQDLMPQAKFDDPNVLQKIVYERFDVIPSKDASDDAFQLRFRYDSGTSGAAFLNGFAKMLIEKTGETLSANGRSMLIAARTSKENQLIQLREMRDVRIRQLLLEYHEAMETAKSVNIEKPFSVIQESPSPIVVAPGRTPLFLYGSQALAAEIKNIEARKGNDLAIPEFSEIASTVADLGRRLTAIDQPLGAPIVITQLAYEGQPLFPPETPIVLICIAIGAACAGCWEYLRSQKSGANLQI